MKLLQETIIFGANGQLGRELASLMPDAFAFGHSAPGKTVDIESMKELEPIFESVHPDVVINAAAITDVDSCEIDKDRAYAINATSVLNITQLCRRYDAKLYHISTDYVFDGNTGGYKEYSTPNPINYYGFSKAMGDAFALSYENSSVIRTSGVYGRSRNFPFFTYQSLASGKSINVIKGFYSPIHAKSLAMAIVELMRYHKNLSGIINIAGEKISRVHLAQKIAELFNYNTNLICEVDRITQFKASRPFDSSLDISYARGILKTDFYSTDHNLEIFKKSLLGEKK